MKDVNSQKGIDVFVAKGIEKLLLRIFDVRRGINYGIGKSSHTKIPAQ
ncbi:hypothetical protein SAM19_03462 [Brevibacillus laterosporus]|nr:hypothetical protein [Brevibacillus laterosporus]